MTETNPAEHPLLYIEGLTSGYGTAPVLHDVSLEVKAGELLTIIGGNGAGKSTLLKTVSGLLPKQAGCVRFDGQDITGVPAHEIAARGLLHVAEGHRIFRQMTVNENLQVSLWGTRTSRQEEEQRRRHVFGLFPVLEERLESRAAVLSGGEQQMLAIAQALMQRPRLLMLDEPSLGLAPRMIDMVFEVIKRLQHDGMTIILVEQVVERALDAANSACLIQGGRVVVRGTPEELRRGDAVRRAYLGATGG